MKSYLLTWNPNNWPQTEEDMKNWLTSVKQMKRQTSRGKPIPAGKEDWSTGSRKSMAMNDRVFLLKQGDEPTGIIARGAIKSKVRRGRAWRTASGWANYVQIEWDHWVEPDDALSLSPYVRSGSVRRWLPHARASGIELTEQEQRLFEGLWTEHFVGICRTKNKGGKNQSGNNDMHSYKSRKVIEQAEFSLPDEVPLDTEFYEGEVRSVVVDAYERSNKARRECIRYWGTACAACGMLFHERYGCGKGFIHVHHRQAIAKRKGKYKIDPVKDLIPVCPNCHAALHINPSLTVEELKKHLQAVSEVGRVDR